MKNAHSLGAIIELFFVSFKYSLLDGISPNFSLLYWSHLLTQFALPKASDIVFSNAIAFTKYLACGADSFRLSSTYCFLTDTHWPMHALTMSRQIPIQLYWIYFRARLLPTAEFLPIPTAAGRLTLHSVRLSLECLWHWRRCAHCGASGRHQ